MSEVVNFPRPTAVAVDPSLVDPPGLIASSSNVRQIILELEHEICDLTSTLAMHARQLAKYNPPMVRKRAAIAVLGAFVLGMWFDPPTFSHAAMQGVEPIHTRPEAATTPKQEARREFKHTFYLI
jgi:hypothetical protein